MDEEVLCNVCADHSYTFGVRFEEVLCYVYAGDSYTLIWGEVWWWMMRYCAIATLLGLAHVRGGGVVTICHTCCLH